VFGVLVEPAAVAMAHVFSVDPFEDLPATVTTAVVLRSGQLPSVIVLEVRTTPYVRGFDNFAIVLSRRSVR